MIYVMCIMYNMLPEFQLLPAGCIEIEMDKFLIKRPRCPSSTSNNAHVSLESVGNAYISHSLPESETQTTTRKASNVEFNPDDIISDPGLRLPIESYNTNIRDQVRRAYLAKGPYQPCDYNFPQKQFNKIRRSFQKNWFTDFDWLEYSVAKDEAYCLWCYLFKPTRAHYPGKDVFTTTGFNNWKKALNVFREHVGSVGSFHNEATRQCQAFKNQRQSISHIFSAQGYEIEADYRNRLTASLSVIRLLLRQGLAFRGHDESSTSLNKGNFLEILEWHCENNEQVAKNARLKAPGNCQLTSPKVQKELVNACATMTRSAILADIGDKFFSLMVDESRDISLKEQMAVVFRYVNNGEVIERFFSVEHVTDTSSLSLKNAIDMLFARHGLSLSRLRGQGYDGASNMSGKFNGLQSLILKENPAAHYIHCFAHQLQLVVVSVAKGSPSVSDFVDYLCRIVNLVGASCKRKDMFRQKQHDRILQLLESGEITSGKGKNQETSLTRPGDTRWGSYHKTILRLFLNWPIAVEVLGDILEDATNQEQKGIAQGLLEKMETFKFVFMLHLMKEILGITNDLSEALQRKTQNIINAVTMVRFMKVQLQSLREEKWEAFLEGVKKFCVDNFIEVPNMEDRIPIRGRSRREGQAVTYFHLYRVEIYCGVIDLISQEMENRFTERNTELLTCIGTLDPRNSFSSFDHAKLLQFAQFYPQDFSLMDQELLVNQLHNFIYDVRSDKSFSEIQDIGQLAIKMVKTHRNSAYPLVYRLIELALVLPIATATVERVFSAMKIVKSYLRNRMGDEWMNDSMMVYIEKAVFATVDNEDILQHYQQMQNRRIQLPSIKSSTKDNKSLGT
ncbi:hypothetical protein OROMI_024392 [Orobanche minor]